MSTRALLLEHMHKKFEINQTKIKGSYQSGKKVVTHNSKSDLPLAEKNLPQKKFASEVSLWRQCT